MENHPNAAAFAIEDGVLTAYSGPGGDVTIPEGVTEIGEIAFAKCASLTSVTLPKGVAKIGARAFAACGNLTSVTFPEGVAKIENGAFANCKSLTSVTLPEGAAEIGDAAFTNCANLTSVTLPESLREIGAVAFSSCDSLPCVTIPKNVRKIHMMAFGGCKKLACVTLLGNTDVNYAHVFLNIHPVLIAPRIPISRIEPWNQPDACCGFARLYWEGAELDEEIRAGYLKFIGILSTEMIAAAVRHEELLRVILAEKLMPRNYVPFFLEECEKQHSITATATILEYANRNFPPKDPLERLKL